MCEVFSHGSGILRNGTLGLRIARKSFALPHFFQQLYRYFPAIQIGREIEQVRFELFPLAVGIREQVGGPSPP